jgi:ubiquitin carboxyl-terminal hydrolase 1
MSRDQRLYDLFDGDPDLQLEYHHVHREEDTWDHLTHPAVVLPLLTFTLALIYHIFFILDFDLLPLPELLWNCLVYATPSKLLDVLENYTNPLRTSNPALETIPRTHAAKSEAMRRIFGLDKQGGIMGSVAQAGKRRLSTLPGIKMATQEGDGGPPGLGNWDNSCYQNSVLQGLASLEPLSAYLTSPGRGNGAVEVASRPDMKMAEALSGLIATLNDPSNNGRRIWTPATLKSMSSWQQQDAQEYFSKVLDQIDKEIGKVAGFMRRSQGFEMDSPSLTSSRSSEPSPMEIFRNPLEGLIAQRVGCTKCGYSEGLSLIPFNCLTVPLGRAWEYDVTECLDEYTKLEQIEGVECGKCTLLKTQRLLSKLRKGAENNLEANSYLKQATERLAAVTDALEDDDYEDKTLLHKCKIPAKNRVSSTKSRQAVIARPPKSLVVHFNRSLFDDLTGELKKNYAEVRFPKTLDLGPWCLGSSGTTQDGATEEWLLDPERPMIASSGSTSKLRGPLYELRAVVTHYGRHENGHYICYKKHPDSVFDEKCRSNEQWWRISDDDVMKVSEENVLAQGGVFMLFFDCVESATTTSTETFSLEPEHVLDGTAISDVALAVTIPLPGNDASDDEKEHSLRNREASSATSVSEFDEDDNEEYDPKDYRPTQAILVPPFIQQTGVRNEGKSAGPQGMIPGSLVMV